MNGQGEVGSPDPLDSFPPLRVRQSDGASRHSSCDGDSEFERYCSANSMMGTPSTSMSMCSAITLFHDFSDVDFSSGRALEDANNASEKRNFRYGSSGLELYGDCSDELAMTEFDSSELIVFNRTEVSNANENRDVRVGESGMDGFELEIGEREMERGEEEQQSGMDGFELEIGEREMERGEEEQQQEEREEEKELSEDEDSMYNYGSDDDSGNESFLSRSIQYHHREPEERNENPFFMNSSVAFGSQDLHDFLLQSGQDSVTNDLFCNQQEKDFRVEEDDVNSVSVSSSGFGRKEGGKDEKDMDTHNEEVEGTKDIGDAEPVEEVRDIPAVSGQVQRDGKLDSVPVASSISKDSEEDLVQLAEAAPQNRSLNVTDGGSKEKEDQHVNSEGAIAIGDAQHANPGLDNSKFKFVHFHDSRVDQNSSGPSIHIGNTNAQSDESLEQIVPHSNSGMRKTSDSSSTLTNLLEKSHVIFKKEDFELNEFYDEVVQEMEEILLDSVDSPGARLAINRLLEPQLSMPIRDGGLTASTSSTDDAYLLAQPPRKIDRIEVVGARQKKGDVSFSERLVGVKEYTLYKIKVWSGKDQWEVERRYRDFLTLHHCMKALFNEQGWILPLPWCSIEKESKIFGSVSPDIIVKRSILIQECLQSILRTGFFSSPPKALIWFLSPHGSYPVSPASDERLSQSSFTQGETIRNFSTLGKTISLIVEIPPNKSMKQLLEAQHHTCAGCHKHFDDGKTLIWDFVTTFGWGKARLCEYTGQLFCSSCHTNETAVLPARVLHHWDFTHYPVSQLAKSYLDSIHEQPMLCVTAVNPFLLSKVPAMLHVMSVRKKIATMLPYVRCPFRRSINRGLGNRRYLLESNDFFALRDLIDLSKGVFAALPVMVETLSRKILEHVTDQCLICCDAGVPCSARQDCSDPSSLIFPFQEDDIERCRSCQMVFHKRCFRKLANCPCGAQLRLNETRSLTNRVSQRGSNETKGTLDLLGRGLSSSLSPRILSGLFTKQNTGKIRERKDENIILMGSLPSNYL